MKPKFTLAAILFILLASTIAFAQPTIKAEVDKTSITADDNITYKLTVTSTEKKIPEPRLPKFEGFYVLSQVQSSAVSFAKSNIEATLVYAYVLAPKDAGKFQIEPSQITIKGKTYPSETFEIEVKQGKTKPRSIQPESDEPQTSL